MDRNFKQAGDVVQSFVAVSRTLTGFTQQNASSLGLTMPQMGILNAIFANMGATLKEISERLQLPKSSVSIAVDDLVNMGLVERKSSEDDRREISLKTTPKGEELARKSIGNSSSYKAMQWALDGMTEQEVHTLLALHESILLRLKDFKASLSEE